MATKKQKRSNEKRTRKKKKGTRLLILACITLTVFGSLIFLFVTLFDSLYPPVTGKEGSAGREKLPVTLYFSDANERYLVPETRRIPKGGNSTEQAKELVKALLAGSKTNLVNTFPVTAELQSVKIDKSGLASVSFSKELVKAHPGGSASEMATIFSLTNTLAANLSDIKEVALLVDGRKISSINGHIDTRGSFTPNKDMLVPDVR